ncbi:MAG: threonine synthase [Chitinophagaceae bacterium]|nr:threonine synthase [Chitinophagaceae bacterium]
MESLLIPTTLASELVCSNCQKTYSIKEEQLYATCCNKPLLVQYDLDQSIRPEEILTNQRSIWRYASLLPVFDKANQISLGEGDTPLLTLNKLAGKYGYRDLVLKDESFNPTGSFKARGLSVAISKAKEFKRNRCIVPTAGNAGGAMAAYCAKAGIEATVVMPVKTPEIFKEECRLYGAELILVDGLINDCAKKVSELNIDHAFFDVSTLKEPYRLEGKKTMGYEIAEQLGWQLPDIILYPAGGGTGLIGLWKAFKEMKMLGWIKGKLPRMVAVQTTNCGPIAAAFKDPINWKMQFTPRATIANGLAVPFPFGMDLMLQVLKESKGEVCLVDDADIVQGLKEIAKTEGLIISPEGAATWMALRQLTASGKINYSEKIVLLNTGTGYKYLENL